MVCPWQPGEERGKEAALFERVSDCPPQCNPRGVDVPISEVSARYFVGTPLRVAYFAGLWFLMWTLLREEIARLRF